MIFAIVLLDDFLTTLLGNSMEKHAVGIVRIAYAHADFLHFLFSDVLVAFNVAYNAIHVTRNYNVAIVVIDEVRTKIAHIGNRSAEVGIFFRNLMPIMRYCQNHIIFYASMPCRASHSSP